MTSNIYKAPLSELKGSRDEARPPKNALKYLVLAFFASPLISSLIFVTIFFWLELGFQNINYGVGLFIIVSLITYAVVLIFVLPLHWALGIANWRKSYVYILVGAAIPFVVSFFLGMAREPIFWSLISVKGAMCSVLFWFFAVYLFQKKPHNKHMQGKHTPTMPSNDA